VATVLVIEDNADLREMYAEILGMGGHAVRGVETASEALAAIEEQRPDVAVLDLGISGGSDPVIEALKSPAAGPVALILASGARDLAERAREVGAVWLQKPFGPEKLLEAVERAALAEGG
jgi:two-component system, NtrC family, nitrogen regulation response regulator NtrX